MSQDYDLSSLLSHQDLYMYTNLPLYKPDQGTSQLIAKRLGNMHAVVVTSAILGHKSFFETKFTKTQRNEIISNLFLCHKSKYSPTNCTLHSDLEIYLNQPISNLSSNIVKDRQQNEQIECKAFAKMIIQAELSDIEMFLFSFSAFPSYFAHFQIAETSTCGFLVLKNIIREARSSEITTLLVAGAFLSFPKFHNLLYESLFTQIGASTSTYDTIDVFFVMLEKAIAYAATSLLPGHSELLKLLRAERSRHVLRIIMHTGFEIHRTKCPRPSVVERRLKLIFGDDTNRITPLPNDEWTLLYNMYLQIFESKHGASTLLLCELNSHSYQFNLFRIETLIFEKILKPKITPPKKPTEPTYFKVVHYSFFDNKVNHIPTPLFAPVPLLSPPQRNPEVLYHAYIKMKKIYNLDEKFDAWYRSFSPAVEPHLREAARIPLSQVAHDRLKVIEDMITSKLNFQTVDMFSDLLEQMASVFVDYLVDKSTCPELPTYSFLNKFVVLASCHDCQAKRFNKRQYPIVDAISPLINLPHGRPDEADRFRKVRGPMIAHLDTLLIELKPENYKQNLMYGQIVNLVFAVEKMTRACGFETEEDVASNLVYLILKAGSLNLPMTAAQLIFAYTRSIHFNDYKTPNYARVMRELVIAVEHLLTQVAPDEESRNSFMKAWQNYYGPDALEMLS